MFALIYVIIRVEDINISEKFVSIFDLTLPIQAVKNVLKKREGSKRKNILLMVLVPIFHTLLDSSKYKFQNIYQYF